MKSKTAVPVVALGAYVLLALLFSWPLALHLGSHLTGPPNGDTDAYVWNQWVFSHEVLEGHRLPFFSDRILSLTGPANLSLHNYTVFQDLIAVPLLRVFDVVTTFNIVYLLMIVLTGTMTFLLACHVTNRPFEAWLAGALFSWSPWMVTRGTGHFSLVAAAPLALFVLIMLRSADTARLRNAVGLGATLCWAATTDPYYAIYCVMIAVVFLAVRTVHVVRREIVPIEPVPWALDVLIVSMGSFVVSLLFGRGWTLTARGFRISAHETYTPMLLLTVLVLLRIGWAHRALVVSVDRSKAVALLRLASVAALVSAVMLSPVLYAVGSRIRDVGLESTPILWRSSPPGVDLVNFFLPNPNHPLAPDTLRSWLATPQSDRYLENVASLTFVSLITILTTMRTGWKPPLFWVVLTVGFGLLSLGPFVHIAGFNTHIPGPWALIRYVPVVRLARSPARLAVVSMLGMSVLFAIALAWIGNKWPQRRKLALSWVTVLLLIELLPAPRPLYSASIPLFFARVAVAPSDVRVLQLPFGIRDGTSSIGNFSARAQFFQTMHGKRIVGGYLSRVSRRRFADIRGNEVLNALVVLSEGHTLDAPQEAALLERGPAFMSRSNIGFVVIDRDRASPPLQAFAIRALRLQHLEGDENYDLYSPTAQVP